MTNPLHLRRRSNKPGSYVPPPVPSGDKLWWSPPALSSPVIKALSNGSRSVPYGNNTRDLEVTCSEVLTAGVGETYGYGNARLIAGQFNSYQSPESSGHLIPRKITGIWHIEGWKFFSSLAGDFVTSRERAAIIQMQACDVNVSHGGISYHSDCFQTQITQIDELRIDRCTFRSDWTSVVLINESPIASSPAASFVNHTVVRRTVFYRGQLGKNMCFFLSKPPKPGNVALGLIEMYDVWMEDSNICYPGTDFGQWDGGSTKFGAFRINKLHANGNIYPFWKFSTSADTAPSGGAAADCNVRGDGGVWIFPQGGSPPAGLNLGAPANAGMGYTSPGYL